MNIVLFSLLCTMGKTVQPKSFISFYPKSFQTKRRFSYEGKSSFCVEHFLYWFKGWEAIQFATSLATGAKEPFSKGTANPADSTKPA